MPELPEVEFARRGLEAWLLDRRILRVSASGSYVEGNPQSLRGERLREARRWGKWILLFFTGERGLLSHLGMTGKWVLRTARDEEPDHSLLRLHLARGQVVHFRDPRRFGRLIFGNSFDLVHSRPWVQLGPDPLKSGVDPVRLRNVFQRTSRTVKETLMDQTVLAGLGNIQAAEALFLARIHPHRRARSLAPSEVRALARAIVRSLRRTLDQEEAPEWRPRTDAAASTGPVASTDVAVPTAVARRHVAQRRGRFAVSDVTYVEEAGAENPFLVYGHEGEPCPRCRTPIVRTVLGGRATFFCPWCQARTRR